MHNKKLSNVLNLPSDERFYYFIRKICDFEEIWGLFNDGWAMSVMDNENTVMSFWPERKFASLCATESWLGYEPKLIPLEEFIQKWLKGMEKDNIHIGVFQTPEDKAVVISAPELKQLLQEELENYE